MTISFPGEGRGPGPVSSWTPAFAGEQEYWIGGKA